MPCSHLVADSRNVSFFNPTFKTPHNISICYFNNKAFSYSPSSWYPSLRSYISVLHLPIMVVLIFQQPQNPPLHSRTPSHPQAHNLVSHPKGQGSYCACPCAVSPWAGLQVHHHPLHLRRPRPRYHSSLLRPRKHLHHNILAPTNFQ